MVERRRWLDWLTHGILMLAVISLGVPVYYAFVAATLPIEEVVKVPMPLIPGDQLATNVVTVWESSSLGRQLINSLIVASGITIGKIVLSLLAAFAIVYFKFRFRMVAFWMIFSTLMLPVEVRIVPTFEVAANVLSPLNWFVDVFRLEKLYGWFVGHDIEIELEWSLLNSYLGLTLPLAASATSTFLFRQFFLTIPEELCEAAKIDGSSPMRFFFDILLPMSVTNIAALSIIMFIFGWNQYLWPLLITTEPEMTTVAIGVNQLVPAGDQPPTWNTTMAGVLIIMLPPVVIVLVMQRMFVKGLIESEK